MEIFCLWILISRFCVHACCPTGIWGGKGQGKSFQTELIFQAMGVEPVIMSAGELESERAGKILCGRCADLQLTSYFFSLCILSLCCMQSMKSF